MDDRRKTVLRRGRSGRAFFAVRRLHNGNTASVFPPEGQGQYRRHGGLPENPRLTETFSADVTAGNARFVRIA